MKPHTIFLRVLFFLMTVLLSPVVQAKIAEENQRKLDVLSEMTDTLKTKGIPGLLADSGERHWVAPKMFSAWFIAKLPDDPDGNKLVEQAKSAFGHEMARQLTPLAKVVRGTKEAAILEKQSDILFAVLAWLGTETAYANMLLQQRADDIASIAATKLMCDINYPLEKASKAMKRFDSQNWGSPERSRQVLFEESGGKHFLADGAATTEEKLDREFREGVDLVIKLGSIAGRLDLEIFTREDFAQGESVMDLERTWSKRAHINFAERGFGSVNLRNLATMHEFRTRYGKLPTQPVSYQPKPGESKIAAAFKELSWENPYGIGGAADTFEAYLDGRLVDEVFRATDRRFNPNAK
ncbi:MAG: hypothetical protein KA004_12400 [Verrucomicrobiales bacterium]|nr:hypothetical protein [Verrucomicrobiales bacterium]